MDRRKQFQDERQSTASSPQDSKYLQAIISGMQQYDSDAKSQAATRRHAEEAFSSSSEDDEDGAPPRPNTRKRSARVFKSPASEFDKALLTGVPSKGAASFEHEFTGLETTMSIHHEQLDDSTVASHSTTGEPQHPELSAQQQYASRKQMPPPKHAARTRPDATARPLTSHVATPPPIVHNPSVVSSSASADAIRSTASRSTTISMKQQQDEELLAQGVLPDVLMSMRQKIESLTLFDSDMLKLTEDMDGASRDSLKRSSQQSLSAAVLVSLAHKRYERRRLAAMEIEKVVRSLVHQKELDRVRAILVLLSDDYVRSANEDARKGGVVALAACGIGMKKALPLDDPKVFECRDLILASVVHACQDHSQRVRYYATESLFNVVKCIPTLAVQHFFILFEILRSLYADVDVDVRGGSEMLDKKLKEVIVGAINSGSFSADMCVPIFARFVYMRNKATKRLTLTWLQELNEKLLGNPVLEFLHLFLGGIFAMIGDPNIQIRQSALAFLQSVLPKLLVDNEAFDDAGASMKVDFDKLIQSLVTTLEHPDPFVRKVAMYWMCRIVKAYMAGDEAGDESRKASPASISVRNSLPHVLPGILLSIGDTFHMKASTKDSFLPDQTTNSLAEQTNACLQAAVRRDGTSYVTHLDGFLVALREELASPGTHVSSAVERKQYRIDATPDGTGIESPGWFHVAKDEDKSKEDTTINSRLCALEWITVLYSSVVPDGLKAEYAREFINPIIHQLIGNPPERIVYKSLEVLATITVPVRGEKPSLPSGNFGSPISSALAASASFASLSTSKLEEEEDLKILKSTPDSPMTNADATFALEILDYRQGQSKSRDRGVFSALIQLHAHNYHLVANLSRVIQYMCTLQAPGFVFVSFAVELDRFVRRRLSLIGSSLLSKEEEKTQGSWKSLKGHNYQGLAGDLHFVSSFVQQMAHVMLATDEAKPLRDLLRDCIGKNDDTEQDKRRTKLFHILLYSFSHNLVASVSLCLWAGAFRTAAYFLENIDPLDVNLMFLLELDKMVEMLERPLFRHFHLLMLEVDDDPSAEGSGAMLFRSLTLMLMIVPQSTCYRVLRDRLTTISRFRQSALQRNTSTTGTVKQSEKQKDHERWMYASRVLDVRDLHCNIRWETIRSESLETKSLPPQRIGEEGRDRREWLGYANKDEESLSKARFQEEKRLHQSGFKIEEIKDGEYHQIDDLATTDVKQFHIVGDRADIADPVTALPTVAAVKSAEVDAWKEYWTQKKEHRN